MSPLASTFGLCLLLAQGEAFRHRHQKTEPSFIFRRRRTIACPDPKPGVGKGSAGSVDYLYSFGAPGTSSPGLQHQGNADGIIPGLRSWIRRGLQVDIVPAVTSTVWLWHPKMDAESIAHASAPKFWPADNNMTQRMPSQFGTSVLLHMPWEYWSATAWRNCTAWYNYSMFSLNISYVPQPRHAARLAALYGWGIVGSAYYDGSAGLIGGPQASHLLQNPETLECTLTFQGTQSLSDWYSNLAFRPTHFCGFVEPGEECGLFGFDTCKVSKPRGSFTHWGFADTLRRMAQVPEWQAQVRANLGKCSAVYATGHSLGGASASLLTACVSKELKRGDYGFEDYDLLSWTKASKAVRMPTVAALPAGDDLEN